MRLFKFHKKMVGWSLAIILPASFYLYSEQTIINWAVLNFLVIFISALVMWSFRLVAEYVPALFMILASVVLGLAPSEVVLSGFMSNSFFMALSVFGLSAVIISSGIFYRFSLFLLRHLPHNVLLLQIIIFIMSLIMTPIMTAQSSRISMLVPMINDLSLAARLKKRKMAVNGLAMAAFSGAIYFSMIFMTGKSSNLVLYGMLPDQIKEQFTWVYWLRASLVPGILIFIVSLIQLKLGFNSKEKIDVSKDIIEFKAKSLGPMKQVEWIALLSVILTIIGLIFSSSFNIQPTWISFGILVALMALGTLGSDKFKQNINWPFLFYLGGMVGIMESFQYLEIDQWVLHYMNWLVVFIGDNSYVFILTSYIAGFLSCFIFGTAAAPAISYAILSPLADNIHFNSWLLVFVLLMATESWLFPYQSSYYLCFEEMTNEYDLVDNKHILKQNAIFVIFRILIIFASVWYWKGLGIL